jgi:Domain of unknown function (DUF4160)
MPTIATVSGVSIVMYYNDHDPAHFHALHNGSEAVVRIADLHVMRNNGLSGSLLHDVCQWAVTNQKALALEWAKARSHLPLGRL